MWTNTIGMESEAGGNSAIEAAINAPQFGAGRGARKAAAAEAVKHAGTAAGLELTASESQLCCIQVEANACLWTTIGSRGQNSKI